jgi:hypothetical protein
MSPSKLESPESSSPIITRAVAAGLVGEYCQNYQFPAWQKLLLNLLGRFPQSLARALIARFQSISGMDPARLDGLTVETLAHERLQDYAGLTGTFPTVTLGAALGGASAHLALALGGPFLPQAFVTTLRGGAPDGDPHTYLNRSLELALKLARTNPGLFTIQHYDPVHDGWLTRHVNHLRFKLLDLPQAYRDFLHRHLEPGGAIVFLNCGARWLRYRLGERSIFQLGGWGDISAQEFISGSPRLQNYALSAGLSQSSWGLTGYSLEEGPESEWGCEPGFGVALQAFCKQNGFRFVEIALPHPHDYSRLAFSVQRALLEEAGLQPQGVLIETFGQFDATTVHKAGLLPLWLVFNTRDSLVFLESMRPQFENYSPVFYSPLITFSLTPDMVPWEGWDQALAGLDWRNIGARPSHYPADALALTNWTEKLRGWAAHHPRPINTYLSPEKLQAIAASLNS